MSFVQIYFFSNRQDVFTLEMKNPLQKNATRTTVFGGTQFIVVSLQAGMSMWSIFDQLEMYMKKFKITSQWKCYIEKQGVLEIKHVPY